MQCFNCGQDADMEVYMMINGEMKKLSICMDCYREQTEAVMENIQDEDGNIDPEKIQKQMFDFMQNNKEEFNTFLSTFLEDVDMSEIDMDKFKSNQMDFTKQNFDFSDANIKDIFNKMSEDRRSDFVKKDNAKYNPFETFGKTEDLNREYHSSNNSSLERQVKMIQKSIDKKRNELFKHIEEEEYMKAAGARDELRAMNKKIMVIRKLEKEGESSWIWENWWWKLLMRLGI